MQQEISSGTMLGIVLIALAAVIGLGFGVFSIAKGVANEGTVNVQDNLANVSASAFEDYNDKVVTGTMVQSAIQNFSGKSVAILVNNVAMDKGVVSYKSHEKITAFRFGDKVYVNYGALFAVGEDGNSYATTVNGGAKLTKDSATVGTQKLKNSTDDAVLNDGTVVISHAFAIDTTGKVKFDNSVGGLTRTGNSEYINSTAKYEANLIKDTSGTVIGIMFTQMAR